MEVACPFCGSTDVVKRGRTSNGKQRYGCRNKAFCWKEKHAKNRTQTSNIEDKNKETGKENDLFFEN
jgi:transposase-like protein